MQNQHAVNAREAFKRRLIEGHEIVLRITSDLEHKNARALRKLIASVRAAALDALGKRVAFIDTGVRDGVPQDSGPDPKCPGCGKTECDCDP